MVRTMATEQNVAEMMRKLHPSRLRFSLFSDQNPLMKPIESLAETVRGNRRPVPADNAFLAMEQMASEWITSSLDALAAARYDGGANVPLHVWCAVVASVDGIRS